MCEPWGPLVPSCLPECWSPNPEAWTEEQRFAVQAASDMLHRLTAGVYGQCTVTVRPCGQPEECPPLNDMGVMGVSFIRPMLIEGNVRNFRCGCRGRGCSCGPECKVVLDPFCSEMVEVLIDGKPLPRDAYDVQDYRLLMRMDGGCWPDCQHMNRHEGHAGTWTVKYKTGWPPDAGGRLAVTRLAVEMRKACTPGAKGCQLSEWVTQVVRDGVTYQIDLSETHTGLPLVDRWVRSVNPYGVATQFRAWSPDTVRSRRTTWTGSQP